MALKKSELYSSLWSSCDELRGGMDASQYKDYVLVLLFIKYVSDKYAGQPYAPITIPDGRQLQGHGRAQGQARHRRPDQQEDHRAAGQRQQAVRHAGLQRRHQARQRQGDGGPAHQPHRHLREQGARLLEEPRRGRRHPGRRLRIPDAALRHRERQEQGPVLHARRSQPHHGADHRHPRREDERRHHRLRPDLRLRLAAAEGGRRGRHCRSRSTGRKKTPPPAAWRA